MKMTLTQRIDLCFYGGLVIAIIIVILGLLIGYHYQNPWIALAGEIVALIVACLYIDLVVKFVKIKEPDYIKHNQKV